MKLGMLLSLSSFEGYYGRNFHLTKAQYLATYRNDFSWDYARGLAEAGVEVTIFLPSWQEDSDHRVEPNINVKFLRLKSWGRLWELLPWLGRTPPGRYIAEVANGAAVWPSLKRAMLECQIDILYVQEYWSGRFDFLTSRRTPPIIAADHGGRKRRQITLFKRRSLQRAAAITCQTEDEVEQVKAFGVIPIKLSNGVDTAFFAPDESVERERFVLTVARLNDRQKRVSDLISAVAYLPAPWRLVIAGRGPDEPALRALVAEKNLQSRVEFLGFVGAKTTIRDLFRRCGVFSMASAYEGIPMAALEAMACGAPLAVSDIRAFQEVVENNVSAYLFPVGDISAIAAAIERAFDERVALSAMSRRLIVQRYSRSGLITRLTGLLAQHTS